MRFPAFSILRSDGPPLKKGLERLFRQAGSADEYTLPDLQQRLNEPRTELILPVLADLTRERVVDQVFRVLSPKQGGIDDFASLDAVPDRIYDWRQDREIDVDPRLVRLIFRKHRAEE